MLNTFGGSARDRPRVKLGGNRTAPSRSELLHRSAEERQRREDDRRQSRSQKTISQAWRSSQARTKAMNVLRYEFDGCSSLLERPTSLERSELQWHTIARMCRLLRFFHNSRLDWKRTILVASYTIDMDLMSNAPTEIRSLALSLMPCLEKQSQKGYGLNDSQRSRVVIAFAKSAVLASPADTNFFGTTQNCETFYKLLRSLLRWITEDIGMQLHVQEVITAICDALDKTENVFSISAFATIMLPCKEFTPVARNLLKVSFPRHYESLIDAARASSQKFNQYDAALNTSEVANFLRNFLILTRHRIGSASPTLDEDVLNSWMGLVCVALIAIWDRQVLAQEHRAVVNATKLTRLQQPIRLSNWDTNTDTDSKVFTQRTIDLDNSTQLEVDQLSQFSLVENMLRCPRLPSGLPEYIETLFILQPACKALLLPALINFVNTSNTHSLLLTSYAWCHADLKGLMVYTPTVVLFLELLSGVLASMVDAEFFNPGLKTFSLDLIRQIAVSLKKAIVSVYKMNYSGVETTPLGMLTISSSYVTDLITEVLQQIQIRDSRRPFLPPHFWIDTAPRLAQISHLEAVQAFMDQDEEDPDQSDEEVDSLQTIEPTKYRGTVQIRLLNNFPFFFPFIMRITTLRHLITEDINREGFREYHATKHQVVCRRGHEFEDGITALWSIGGKIKGPLDVDFRDIYGIPEAGIDGGGLTLEFLTEVCKQAFHPASGLFVETPGHLLYPNPSPRAKASLRSHYEFIGRVIAKCIYQGMLLDVAFAPFFLLKWIHKSAYLDDLEALDDELYHGLLELKHYPGDVENDISLDFSVDEVFDGVHYNVPISKMNHKRPVTSENRAEYIEDICRYKMSTQIEPQSAAFVEGMSQVIDLRWLRMFDTSEMAALVGGNPVPIDVDDLKKNTVYGGFRESDETVQIFWDVLREFDNEERRKLVKFVTSTPRPPLLGFSVLEPLFSLRNAGADQERLPTASTCVNLLKLPAYSTHEQMRSKLRISINAEAGFDLS